MTPGAPSVRLVQDFGGPNDPDAPLPALPPAAALAPTLPPKRPRGSKTREKEEAAEVNQRETAV